MQNTTAAAPSIRDLVAGARDRNAVFAGFTMEEGTPEVVPAVVPEVVPEVVPAVVPEVIPAVVPEVIPEVVPEVTPVNLDDLKEVTDLPKWAQDLITGKNQEATDKRHKANQFKTVLAEVAEAAGVTLDLDSSDALTGAALVAALAAKDTATTEAVQRAVKAEATLAVHGAAAKRGADSAALLNRVDFNQAIQDFDPTAADYAAKVDAAIEAAITSDPTLKTRAVKGAGDIGAGSPEGAVTPEQFTAMSLAERASLKARDPEQYKRLTNR